MRLSISNIGWASEYDDEMYDFLSDNGFDGLEIAPTRIFPDLPYDKLDEASQFAKELKAKQGLGISSMQSIWYEMTESIYENNCRQKLIEYTKKAIDFAIAVDCSNLVFGCPKNRAVPHDMTKETYLPIAYEFFNEIGNYAAGSNVFISIEPNPPIYNTNFINTTTEAFSLCKTLNNRGIKVNIDLGTMIYNNESIDILAKNVQYINHIHLSEPYLVPLEKRSLHKDLIKELHHLGYEKYVSIEVGKQSDIEVIKNIILYVKEIHHEI